MQSKPTQVHGPYIITTWPRCEGCEDPAKAPHRLGPPLSRRAVATLEVATAEAERAVRRWRDEDGSRAAWDAAYSPLSAVANLPESGGSVGPLPDGTVIEVEPIMWADLLAAAAVDSGITREMRAEEWEPRVIAAYNAAQAEESMT